MLGRKEVLRTKPVIKPFSERQSDQFYLSQVNGSIVMTNKGKPMFQFPDKKAFEKFQQLKADAIRSKLEIS